MVTKIAKFFTTTLFTLLGVCGMTSAGAQVVQGGTCAYQNPGYGRPAVWVCPQSAYNNQQIVGVAPQGVSIGQPGFVNGQPCTWRDRAASAGVGAVIANLGAYAINRFSGRGVIDRTGAGIVGGIAGGTLFCDPNIVNDGQRIVVAPQGGAPYGNVGGSITSGGTSIGGPITVPGKCDFGNNVVAYTYEGQTGCDKLASTMTKTVSGGTSSMTMPSSYTVQATKVLSEDDRDTCRLRVNGVSVAEIKLPQSVKKEESKTICDEWQVREARSRGLTRQ